MSSKINKTSFLIYSYNSEVSGMFRSKLLNEHISALTYKSGVLFNHITTVNCAFFCDASLIS